MLQEATWRTASNGAYGYKNKKIIRKLTKDTVLFLREILRDEIMVIGRVIRPEEKKVVHPRVYDTKKREHVGC